MKINELGDAWLDVYTACLEKYRVKEAAAIARYYQPRKIYKYFSFTSKHWQNNVFDYQIVFNVPSSFNDPHDSRWFLDYDKILKERYKEIGEDWEKEALFSNDEMRKNMIQLYEEDLLYLHDLFCISCFSTTPYSSLMWGHYGNKHTGFCLEYDVSLLPNALRLLLPIVYIDVPFDASMILDMRDIDDKYAFICPSLFKSSEWKYEKEWRIFLPCNDEELPRIMTAPAAITGVYLGYRSYGAKERSELENWATENQISLHQIERLYGSFELVSDSIEDIRFAKKRKGLLI